MGRGAAVICVAVLLPCAAVAQPAPGRAGLIERIRKAIRSLGGEPPPAPQPPPSAVARPADPLGHAGPDYLYPNPWNTPGQADPAVTQDNIDQTICRKHYTETVRDVPDPVRDLILAKYGDYNPVPRSYELDHFISLELGGSNDEFNLWPEPYCPLPRRADCFGAREKDVVENWLHREVCAHRMSLHEAQVAIKTDWFAVYQRIKSQPKKRRRR